MELKAGEFDILVGGAGNLGRVMQKIMHDQGRKFRVLDRMPKDKFKGEVPCDFRTYALGEGQVSELVKHLQGAVTVFSMVTPNVQHAKEYEFVRCNEVGVQMLLDAAKEAKVKRFVYVSSIAATNHLSTSVSQIEEDPLPDIDTYQLAYDRSKRRGEQAVIAANTRDFGTCALRAGGILCGPTDYYFGRVFETPGNVPNVPCQPIDFIGARDYCKALVKASDVMADASSPVRGQAFFCTKGKYGHVPSVDVMDKMVADMMGWKFMLVPSFIFKIVRTFAFLKYWFQKNILRLGNQLPGAPPHLWMDISTTQKTFDNSKVRKMLNWEPQESLIDVMQTVVQEYKAKSAKK